MTRRRGPVANTDSGPLNKVEAEQETYLAGEVARVFAAVESYDTSTVKGQLWQKPSPGQGSGFKWIEEIYARSGPEPFDLPAIFADLKERFGGGDYELRIFAGGRQRAVVQIPIAREKSAPAPVAAPGGLGALGDPMSLITLMLQQQQNAADRQMNMMLQMQDSQTKMLAAVLGARPADHAGGSASETVALIAALDGLRRNGEGSGGGMKDMVETLAAVKTLLVEGNPAPQLGDAGGGEGFDLQDVLQNGGRLIGPAIKAVADMVERRRGRPRAIRCSTSLGSTLCMASNAAMIPRKSQTLFLISSRRTTSPTRS